MSSKPAKATSSNTKTPVAAEEAKKATTAQKGTAAKVDVKKDTTSKSAPAKPTTAPVKAKEPTIEEQMAQLQKELIEEEKKAQVVQKSINEVRQANSTFFEGEDHMLADEQLRLTEELSRVKHSHQPKIRPLLNWNRQLKEQLITLPEQLKKLEDENVKLEQTATAATTAASKTAKAPAAKGKTDPKATAATATAAKTTAATQPTSQAAAGARPYLMGSKTIAGTLSPSYNSKMQLREKENEIKKLEDILVETKSDLTAVEAQQATEKASIHSLEQQLAKQETGLSSATKQFESKQLCFMNDVVALRPKIEKMVESQPSDQAARQTLSAYDDKIGDQEVLEMLILDQKALIATPINERTAASVDPARTTVELTRTRHSWKMPPGRQSQLISTSAVALAKTSAVTQSANGNDDFDDSLVQVQPPQVSESLADLAESIELADNQDGQEDDFQQEEEQEEFGEDEAADPSAGEDEDEQEEDEKDEDGDEDGEDEDEGPKRVTIADLMGEKLRQSARKNMDISDNQMRVYSTQQLSVEIEAIKIQERALLTKVESQQYIEKEIKDKISSIQEQLDGGLEIVGSDLDKLKQKHQVLTEVLQEDEEEQEDAMDQMDKCAENIELYDKIVEVGPRQFMDDIQLALKENGEEIEANEGDDKSRMLVERALSRHLTPEEESMKEAMEQSEEIRDESIINDKQKNNLNVFFVLVVALVLLFVTFNVIKKKQQDEF